MFRDTTNDSTIYPSVSEVKFVVWWIAFNTATAFTREKKLRVEIDDDDLHTQMPRFGWCSAVADEAERIEISVLVLL